MTATSSSRRGGWFVAVALTVSAAAAWPAPAGAQSGALRLDFGAARTLPPSGTDAVDASYMLVGISGERRWWGGSGVGFSLMGGRPLGGMGGDWASGEIAGELWTSRPAGFNVGLGARGYAFRVADPYVYETNTVELFPQVRFDAGRVAVTLEGELGRGRSEIAIRRPDGVRRGSHELWHRGLVGEVATLIPHGMVTAGGGVYEGRAGAYRRGFLEWLFTGPATVRLSGEVWDTPRGVQVAGGAGIHVSLGGPWSFRADGGQGLPDPLVRAPRGVQGGGLLSLALLEAGGRSVAEGSTVRLREPGANGLTLVSFLVPAEAGAKVEILGDFTGWEAVPMALGDEGWSVELPIEPGTYHFGFHAGGAWYLPEDAPGRVADDWGQENATLVVPEPDDVTREGL